MTFTQKYKSELFTAAIVVVLCFSLFLAWNEWFIEPTGHTINPRLQQLQDSLAQSRVEKQQMESAYQDSIQNLRQQEADLLADTANHTNIISSYDNIRKKHRSMEVDSAVGLAHYRLRIEEQYSARFNYSYLPH